MYTNEQFEQLEQEEREITEAELALMLLLLASVADDLSKELRDFYSKYGKYGVVTYAEARKWVSDKERKRRLTALLLFVGGAFAIALDDLQKHFSKFLTKVIGKESTFFGVKIDADGIARILANPWGANNLYWLQRLETDVNLWKTYIATDIKRAMLKGENLASLLDRLDKRFESISSALENLALTESTAVGSLSRQQIFKELGIKKYQFYTRPDERRCETCGSMHGHIFPISAYEVGVTASPMHPRCRCWEVPITD